MLLATKPNLAIALCSLLQGALLGGCLMEDQAPQDHDAPDASKVLGGTAIDSSEMPTVVAIKVADFDGDSSISNTYCTGVLISQRHVLTNAHCFLPISSADSHAEVVARTHVFFDTENNRGTPEVDIMAADVKLHEAFELPSGLVLGYADLAVVTLATPVPHRLASPITFDEDDAPVGGEFVVAGYGLYNSSGDTGVLHRLVDVSTSCAPATESDDEYICIDRADRSGPASGDSGAALFVKRDGVLTVAGTHTYSLIGGGANPNYALAQRASNAYYREFLASFGTDVACATNAVCNPACGLEDLDCKTAEPVDDDPEPAEPPCTACEPATDDDQASQGGCQATPPSSLLLGGILALAVIRRIRSRRPGMRH